LDGLEQEIRDHIERESEENIARGMSPEEARRQALLKFGNVFLVEEDTRGVWRSNGLEQIAQDVRYALRTLRRGRGFAVTAVLTLALGISATTTTFSLLDALLLRRLPVADPEQLVILTNPAVGGAAGGLVLGERDHVSFDEFQVLRAGMTSFSGLFAAQAFTDSWNASVNGQPAERVRTKFVSGEYFNVLGVHAILGRTFTADDERGPGSAPYAVISHAYWQRRFAGAPSVLGSRVRIAAADLQIVGVAPAGFLGESVGEAPDVWIPVAMQRAAMPGSNWLASSSLMWLHAIGRLRSGTSLAQAQAEADVVFGAMLRERSFQFASNPDLAANVLKQRLVLRDASRGVSMLRGSYTTSLLILNGFVGLVLAVACISVAALLLARVAGRRKEVDIRLAVGANRFRIFRQLVTESVVLALIAGAIGSAGAYGGVRLLVALVLDSAQFPLPIDRVADLGVRADVRLLLFTIGLCLLTVLVFGAAPAWIAARVPSTIPPGIISRASTDRLATGGSGRLLVAVQIAVSVVLLIGAGWFVGTLRNLERVDLGYSRQIAQMRVDFRSAGYERERLAAAYEAVRDRLTSVPGVRDVTYSTTGLLGDNYAPIRVDASKQPGGVVKVVAVGPDYFARLGIPVLVGRGIERFDSASTLPVCVVNQALASFYFGSEEPLGRYIVQGATRFQVVGVVRDTRDTLSYPASFADNLRSDPKPTFYPSLAQPIRQYPFAIAFQLLTGDDPAEVITAAQAAVQSFNPGLSVTTASTLDAAVHKLVGQERTVAQIATFLGGAALLLACIGLYGLLSGLVARRTSEIGIRMALGADRRTIVGMVLREVAAVVVIGLAIGAPASLAVARFVRSRIFGLGAADPQTLVAVVAIVSTLAAIAAYLPARRAARIDPLLALRSE
jgi:predicted permease